MERVKIIGWLWIGYGILWAGGLVFAFGLLEAQGKNPELGVESILFWAMLGTLPVLGGALFLAGTKGAKPALAALSIPTLIIFPLGTALAGYTLWTFFGSRR